MSIISLIVLISAILNLGLIILLGKRLHLNFLIVSSWWFLWLFVSSFSLTGLDIPQTNTYLIFIFFIFSITIGGFIYLSTKYIHRTYSPNSIFYVSQISKFDHSWIKKIYLANYLIALPVTFFFFQRAIRYFILNPSALSNSYRIDVFQENILFDSEIIGLLYNVIISPIPLTSLFIGTAIYIIKNKIHLLIISSILLSMDAVMMGGRFNFYLIIIMFLISIIYRNKFSVLPITKTGKYLRKHYHKKKVLISLILIIVFILNINITIYRTSNVSNSKTEEIINTYIIEYHTLGFVLFDQELNNPQSLLNESLTYGRASLGILERLVVLLIRRFDRNFESIPVEIGVSLNEFRILGNRDGQPIYYNGYSTTLYPIYKDGGLTFIFLLSLIYGFCLAKFSSVRQKQRDIYTLSILLALIYLGIFGIFTPLLGGNYWLYIIYINIFVPRQNKKIYNNPKTVDIINH